MREGPALRKRREPAAEEEDRAETRHGDHAGVFSDEKHGELEAGVFRVEAGDQLGFGFGKIEGDAIGFRHGGDKKTKKAEELREWSGKNVPTEDAVPSEEAGRAALALDNVAEAETAAHEEHADDRHGQRQFVAN